MEKYAITKEWNGNVSFFNTALFSTRQEAKKYMGWYFAKMAAEYQAHQKYWGGPAVGDIKSDQPNLDIAKVII